MTNEETLNLLKPIMLDGTEKVGDKVFAIHGGEVQISNIYPENNFKIQVSDGTTYTTKGQYTECAKYPSLFKCNPFEWLNEKLFIEQRQNEMLIADLKDRDKNQERVIEVYELGAWKRRVLFAIKNNVAMCWHACDSLDDVKDSYAIHGYKQWRELPTKITKEEALRKCDEIGIDVKDMLLNALSESGVDTTNLIIE